MFNNSKERELENLATTDRKLSFMGQALDFLPSFVLGKDFPGVKQLNLSYNNIQQLDGLERFFNLEELTLDNNQLDDLTLFPVIPSLKTLTLTNNSITHLARLISKLSKAFPSLHYLSLLGNKACPSELSGLNNTPEDYQNYRYYVASHLPHLQLLDFKTITKAERRIGCNMFNKSLPNCDLDVKPVRSSYTPLPKTENIASQESKKVVSGKITYKYVGRRSEGNRFIRNDDL